MAVLTAPDASKAATLDGDIVHAGIAEITKWEEGPDGSLYVYGRATTPEVDTDEQIVDPQFSAKALTEWLQTAPALRVQHNGQRDPAGSGVKVEVNRDGDGAHWVKGVVDEPVAARLVKRGHLRAFSVGIAQPVIERDPTGRARGGVIKSGRIVEVSLVDSPANRSCFLEIAKAAGSDGHAEFTGKVFGAGGLLTKDGGDTVTLEVPSDLSLSISPADLARLSTFKQRLTIEQAATAKVGGGTDSGGKAATPQVVKRDFDPDVGGGVDRDKLPASAFVFPKTRDFPVVTPGDVSDAVSSWGRYKGGESFETFKRRLTALARRKGKAYVVELPEEWKKGSAKKALEATLAKGVAAGKITQAEVAVILAPGAKKAVKSAVCGTCANTGRTSAGPCGCRWGLKVAQVEAKEAARVAEVKRRTDAQAAIRQVLAEAEAVKKNKVICPSCGAMQNAKHGFCAECGHSLPGDATQVEKNHDYVCLNCGHELDKGEKFCPQCGRENPGYLPEADRKIPANSDAEKTVAALVDALERVATAAPATLLAKDRKGKKGKGKKKTRPADGGKKEARVTKGSKGTTPGAGVVGEAARDEKPAGPHREPDGEAVEELEHDAGMEDGDHENSARKAGKAKKKGKGKPFGGHQAPPFGHDSDDDDDEIGKAATTAVDDELRAAMRLKSLNVPLPLGQLHDLTCPAYSPVDVAKAHPQATLAAVDLMDFQAQAISTAALSDFGDLSKSMGLWQAAAALKAADPFEVNTLRESAHKAFRDANPGPASFPTPTQICAPDFRRPYISEGHAAPSPGQEGPNRARVPEAGGISATSYQRPYISDGHAADSPANTHEAGPMPAPEHTGEVTGGPARQFYTNSARATAEHAMRVLHDHISQTFPGLCPMSATSVAHKPVPTPAGVPAVHAAPGVKKPGKGTKKTAATAAKRQRKLQAKVLKGQMTIPQFRQAMGLAAHPAPPAVPRPVPARAPVPQQPPAPVIIPAPPPDTQAIKKAMAEAAKPLRKRLAAQDKTLARRDKILKAQDKVIRKQKKMLRKAAGIAMAPPPPFLPAPEPPAAELPATPEPEVIQVPVPADPDPVAVKAVIDGAAAPLRKKMARQGRALARQEAALARQDKVIRKQKKMLSVISTLPPPEAPPSPEPVYVPAEPDAEVLKTALAQASAPLRRKLARQDKTLARQDKVLRQQKKMLSTLADISLTPPPPPEVAPEPVPAAPPPAQPPDMQAAIAGAAIKAAMAEATAPLLKAISRGQKAQKRQARQLRQVRRTADAIAGQPDTSAAPFRGVALLPKSSGAPVEPLTVAKSAEQAQAALIAHFFDEWRNNPDPAKRMAAQEELFKRNFDPNMTRPQT